jgi:hypothetical protein
MDTNPVKPLWVIEFDQTGQKPSLIMNEREALKLFDQMNRAFQEMLKDFPKGMDERQFDDISRNMKELERWMKLFQKILDNPDNLTGQDPHNTL